MAVRPWQRADFGQLVQKLGFSSPMGSGWQLVDPLEDSVDRFEVEQDLGFWVDQPRTRWDGPLWALKKVVEEAADGRIQPEEVVLKRFRRHSGILLGNRFDLGAEILRDEQGRLSLLEQWADFGRRDIERRDLERLQVYRDSEANWEVRSCFSGQAAR